MKNRFHIDGMNTITLIRQIYDGCSGLFVVTPIRFAPIVRNWGHLENWKSTGSDS